MPRLFTLASAVSLALCLTCAGAWLVSDWRYSTLIRGRDWQADSQDGLLIVNHWPQIFVLPWWGLVATLLILPVIRFGFRATPFRRTPTGLCVRCGYDLRATPDRCPECGTVPRSAETM